MKRSVLLAVLLLAAAGPAPGTEYVGALTLVYDPAVWRVQEGALGRWTAEPAGSGAQSVTIRTDYGGPCSQEAMAALAETAPGFEGGRGTTTLPSGLTVHWAEGDTGCRNATAGPLAACVVHQAQTHLFTAGSSCRHSAYARPKPMELLQGLRPR